MNLTNEQKHSQELSQMYHDFKECEKANPLPTGLNWELSMIRHTLREIPPVMRVGIRHDSRLKRSKDSYAVAVTITEKNPTWDSVFNEAMIALISELKH